MKELERIKKVENDVSRKIELARKNSEKKVNDMRTGKDRLVEERLDEIRKRMKKDSEMNVKDAEKEASDMIKPSDAKIREIQKTAEKNFGKAVQMILEVLTGDKSSAK